VRTVLHIGADKCGSSSIQSFLSHNRRLKTGSLLSNLSYACLGKNGLKLGDKIEKNLKRQVSGYISSASIAKISEISKHNQQFIKSSILDISDDLIFSCEGWLRALSQAKGFNTLLDLVAPPDSNRNVEIVAFVRPPVKWINSAWWQWGIWESDGNFDAWLESAVKSVNWHKYLNQAKDFTRISRLTVEPVYQDVVRQLINILDIRGDEYFAPPSNHSLPREVLELFAKHRKHRPSSHASYSDFLIGHAIAWNTKKYTPTPWVLNRLHIRKIIDTTHDANHKLLELMDETNRKRVLNDQSWWNEDAYSHLVLADPYLEKVLDHPNSHLLASDLFSALSAAVRILRSKDLLTTYLETLAAASDENQSE
jgi:hypothetical protein